MKANADHKYIDPDPQLSGSNPCAVCGQGKAATIHNDFPIGHLNKHTVWTPVADKDVEVLIDKDREYGGSWKKRGGVGAFMMLARKWDRIEQRMQNENINYDIFKALDIEDRQEGILDDIQDLRRYLLLVEGEFYEINRRNQEEIDKKNGAS